MREAIVSNRVAPAVGPYSIATRDGDALYTSGQVALEPVTGKLINGGIRAQTTQVFSNLTAVLSAAGKTLDDVIKVNVFLTDIRDFPEMNDVYAEHFEQPYPARTTVAVAGLPLGAMVEIEVVAR